MVELLLLLGIFGTVLHVDPDAPVSGDGTTWSQAFHHLQDALAAAALGGVSEIRVAEGTYRPDRSNEHTEGTGDRDATFVLLTGVGVRGGYAGFGAPDPDVRDLVAHETVLSGDLLGDDGPGFANIDDNSEHVVTAIDVDASGVLDGVTVTAGHTGDTGAGLRIEGGGPTIVGCTFAANHTLLHGAGVSCIGGAPAFRQCRFDRNHAEGRGAGLYADSDAAPAFLGCTFADNEAEFGAGALLREGTFDACTFDGNQASRRAGGLYTIGIGTVTVRGCVFRSNRAGSEGGGLSSGGTLVLRECSFIGNEAATLGGGMYLRQDTIVMESCTLEDNVARWGGGVALDLDSRADLTIVATTFARNRALSDGGGLYLDDGSVALDGCTFDGNTASALGGAVHLRIDTWVTATRCVFRGNSTEQRGGAWAARADSETTLTDCVFEANDSVEAGALWVEQASLDADRCRFEDNQASRGGAVSTVGTLGTIRRSVFHGNEARSYGGAVVDDSLLDIEAAVFTGNMAGAFGGAVYLNGSGMELVNSVFSGNTAGNSGGAIRNFFGSPLVVNCAFSANEAVFGGAVSNASGAPTVTNSVLWGNRGGALDDMDALTVGYSTVEGGVAGEGNVDADPRFVDPDGADGVPGTPDDDLRLRPGSPCIDAGDNDAVPEGVTTDLDGAARFQDDPDTPDTGQGTPPIVDMGPYEFAACPCDLDDSGAADFGDLVAVLAAWGPCEGCPEDLDGSGTVDFGDALVVLADWGACP